MSLWLKLPRQDYCRCRFIDPDINNTNVIIGIGIKSIQAVGDLAENRYTTAY